MLSRPLATVGLTLCAALLSACAGQPAATPPPEAAPVAAPEPEPTYIERPFPGDSLHDLLLAEFALRRREYNLALDTYLKLSPELNDPAVSAHATHLSQFLERDEETLKAAQEWVALEPDNIEARAIVAQELVRSGRNLEALAHLAAIERAGGSANFAIVSRDFTALRAQEQSGIIIELNALTEEFPDNGSLLLTQALLHNELDQPDLALTKLDRLFTLEPDQNQALLLEASILAEQGAENPYRRIEAVLKDNPEDRALRLRYARLLAATDMRAARTQFEILSAAAPQDGDLLFSLALINREVGDPLAASAYLRQLLLLEQREDEAHYYLGRIEEDREQFEDALLHYQEVGSGGEYMAANGRIGELLLKRGDLERSLEWFVEQRQTKPQYAVDLYALETELLANAGEHKLALEIVEEALQKTPEETSLLYARAMLWEKQGDLQRMETDLRIILDNDPDNATALNALGYTLANRTDRYDEALAMISRALELQPGEPAILDSMGWVLFRLGQHDDALDYLTRAYAEFPDPEVAAHLGELLWVMGDQEEALDIWRSAYGKDPDHPVLKETLQRLDIDLLRPAPAERPTQEL